MTSPIRTLLIDADTSAAQSRLRELDRSVRSFGNGASANFARTGQAATQMGRQLSGANDNAVKLNRSTGSLVGEMGKLRGAAALAGSAIAGIGLGMLVSKSIEATKTFQTLNAQLVVATGSTSAASREFARLQKFAAATPFSLNQSVEGFIKLKNLGLDPSERAMKSYGNTAASLGGDMMQMVEAVADATTGEYERLKTYGIKAKTEGDKIKFTFGDTTTTVKKSSDEIQSYLIKLGETNFGTAMDLQAKTLSGALNTLGDNVDNLLVKFGSGFAPALAAGIEGLTGATSSMDALAESGGRLMGSVLSPLVTTVTLVANNLGLLTTAAVFLAGTMAGPYVTSMIAAGVATARLAAFQTAMTASMLGVSRASVIATASMAALRGAGAGLVAMLGGPMGIALGAAAVGIGALVINGQKASAAIDGLTGSATVTQAALREASDRARDAGVNVDLLGSAASGAHPLMIGIGGAYHMAADAADRLASSARNAAIQVAMGRMAELKMKRSSLVGLEDRAKGGSWSAAIGYTVQSVAGEFGLGPTIRERRDAARGYDGQIAMTQREIDILKATPDAAFNPKKPPRPSAGGDPKKTGGRKAGESDAERIAEAQAEFFRGLENSKKEAALVGLELEKHTKELELQRILSGGKLKNEKELTVEQRKRIADALTETAAQKMIADYGDLSAKQAAEKKRLEAERLSITTQSVEASEDQRRIDEAIGSKRLEYLRLHYPLDDARVKAAEAAAEQAERENIALERGNKILDDRRREGASLVDQLIKDSKARNESPIAGANREYEEQKALILASGKSSVEQAKALAEAGAQLKDNIQAAGADFLRSMSSAADRIADAIGGKAGKGIGALVNIVSLLKSTAAPGEAGRQSNAPVAKALSGLGDAASSLGEMFSSTGGAGKLLAGAGKLLATASDGAAMGGQIATLAKAVGLKKFSSTGAQIGGAIGSFIPIPGGQIIGSVIGGTVGALFKKAKTGSATIAMGPDGELNGDKLTGNSGKMKEAASGAAGAVISGLYSIAQRLGGDLTGTPSVSIGLKDGKYRVDTSGTGQTKVKRGAVDFGKDGAEEAIAFAIKDAIKDGVITGLSGFSTRLLQSGKNLDSAVSLAESYEKLLKELAAIDNPIKAAVDDTVSSLNKMADMMRKNAATQEELANVERYKNKKLEDMKKEAVATLVDFRKQLMGQGSGVTSVNRLKGLQSEFAVMQSKIAAGGQVDQDAFVNIAGQINTLASSIYTTASKEYQSIRASLLAATGGAIDNVNKAFNDATIVAQNQTTQAINQVNQTTQQTNAILQQILSAVQSGGGGTLYTSRNGAAVNYGFSSN